MSVAMRCDELPTVREFSSALESRAFPQQTLDDRHSVEADVGGGGVHVDGARDGLHGGGDGGGEKERGVAFFGRLLAGHFRRGAHLEVQELLQGARHALLVRRLVLYVLDQCGRRVLRRQRLCSAQCESCRSV